VSAIAAIVTHVLTSLLTWRGHVSSRTIPIVDQPIPYRRCPTCRLPESQARPAPASHVTNAAPIDLPAAHGAVSETDIMPPQN